MIRDDAIALMVSTAYTMPCLNVDGASVLSAKEILKLVDMDVYEVKEYVRLRNIKTVPSRNVQEDAYVLCHNVLFHVGTFSGGLIPSELIAEYRGICRGMIFLHTHPVPLPIPTPEDLISMWQIGYNTECVLSRIDRYLAEMVCIELSEGLSKVVSSIREFGNKLYELVDTYIVVEDEEVIFLPYPSLRSLRAIENEFIKSIKGVAKVDIVLLDMDNNEYEHYIEV